TPSEDPQSPCESRAHHAGAAAHRRTAVAELLRLHGLPLAAVRDRVEAEVVADGVDVHEVVAGVRRDAAVAIQPPELTVDDLVDLASGDAEVLAALRDRRGPVADHVIA